MPLIPFGEYNPDTSDFMQSQSAFLNNVLARGDGYGPFQSLSAYSTALAGTCRGFFRSVKTDGSISIFAATATKLYQLNNTNQTWTDVSKGSSTYSAVSSTDNWQFTQYINNVIAVQANTVPQVFDLTSSTNFADLGGSPPQAKYVATVGDFVILTGLVNNPYRVQWSGLGLPASWTAGVNSSDFQDLPDGGLTRGVAGGEYGNVFQDNAIRRMIYAPGSDVIFQIVRISEDRGLYAPYSLIRSGEQIFFIGPQGFLQMAPTGYPIPIGKEKIDRTFLADIDKGNLQLVLGASDPRHSRVFWAYKSNDGITGLFDKMISYDYVLKKFTPLTVTGEFLAPLSQPGLTLENLDSISSSIDALLQSLDSFATSVAPEIAAFDLTHKLGFFRGPNLEATLETGSTEISPGQRVFVRGIRPATDAETVFGQISMRERLGAIVIYSTEQAMDSSGFIPQLADTRYPRGRLRIPASTDWTFASGLEPDFAPGGFR